MMPLPEPAEAVGVLAWTDNATDLAAASVREAPADGRKENFLTGLLRIRGGRRRWVGADPESGRVFSLDPID
jgi:hypothetical protein